MRVLTRRAHAGRPDGVEFMIGDLATGAGVDAAVGGVSVIVHCASNNKGDADTTRTLVRAAVAQPDPPHLVYISIVGIDRIPFGYYKAKLECERIVAGGDQPWTVLRATQFHDLILTGASLLARLPLVPVPDMGGPEITTFADLIRTYLRVNQRRRRACGGQGDLEEFLAGQRNLPNTRVPHGPRAQLT